MRFDGKAIIVTGGAQGIGRACVEAFVAEGGAVVIADLATSPGEAPARRPIWARVVAVKPTSAMTSTVASMSCWRRSPLTLPVRTARSLIE